MRKTNVASPDFPIGRINNNCIKKQIVDYFTGEKEKKRFPELKL